MLVGDTFVSPVRTFARQQDVIWGLARWSPRVYKVCHVSFAAGFTRKVVPRTGSKVQDLGSHLSGPDYKGGQY